jgi:lipopolysaccharide export system ATP-binding protein
MLQTVDLTKSYKGRKVVDNVSVEVRRGEVVGLLGPNGAGKSTTFHIVIGLTPPDSGRVLLDEADLTNLPMYQRARRGISYLPQESSVFRKLTVEENILAVLETLPLSWQERRERVESLLEQFGLAPLRYSRGYMLSGGERRRLEIARSLVISPQYILLDEPFSGIDPIAVLDIQRMIGQFREAGIGVLVTDHNVRETLRVTDRAYIIHDGRIFRSGPPSELGVDPEVRRVYLGESFVLEPLQL